MSMSNLLDDIVENSNARYQLEKKISKLSFSDLVDIYLKMYEHDVDIDLPQMCTAIGQIKHAAAIIFTINNDKILRIATTNELNSDNPANTIHFNRNRLIHGYTCNKTNQNLLVILSAYIKSYAVTNSLKEIYRNTEGAQFYIHSDVFLQFIADKKVI